MLVREPEKRAKLEDLAKDSWLQEGSEQQQPAEYLPLISREHVSDEDHNIIIQKMVSGKIATKEEILEYVNCILVTPNGIGGIFRKQLFHVHVVKS
jgi:SNF related kinase